MDKLAFEQVMAVAIRREAEAHEFYRDVAAKITDKDVQAVFTQLAAEEMGHMELLEKFRADPTMVMKISAPPADYRIAEATDAQPLSVAMKPADAIALAMKKEQQAVEFYRGLAGKATDNQTRDVFLNLANMELGHKHRLENVFVEIGYPEAF